MSDKPIVAEYMVTFGDDGPAPYIALYNMGPMTFMWRRFIMRLDPVCRRPWRLWYYTGLCDLWEREAWREEFALVPVSREWADEHFDWEWRQ